MNKKGALWKKVILYLVLFITLVAASYFLYINILNISSEPIQFLRNVSINNSQPSYTSQQQFYSSMRFTDKNISYYIEPSCQEEKKERMQQAFSKLEKETPLSFYQSQDSKILVSCQASKEETPGKYFIAGEGGPTQVINTSLFYVIEKGKVLLFYKNSFCNNYNIELHELLHVLGFQHSSNPGSIMYNTTSCNQIITYDIIDELTRLYSIPELSDLYFQDITATKHGIYLDFNVEIGNRGLKDSEDTKLELYSQDSNKKFDEFNITSISYGEGKILEVSNTKLPSRNVKQIKFLIVPGQELDDKNNAEELFLPES